MAGVTKIAGRCLISITKTSELSVSVLKCLGGSDGEASDSLI